LISVVVVEHAAHAQDEVKLIATVVDVITCHVSGEVVRRSALFLFWSRVPEHAGFAPGFADAASSLFVEFCAFLALLLVVTRVGSDLRHRVRAGHRIVELALATLA